MYIDRVIKILQKYPHERCLIHTVSHELARDTGDALYKIFGQRIITNRGQEEEKNNFLIEEDEEQKTKKSKHLLRYLNQPWAVLVTAGLTRGIDLPDDLCRNVIIAKVPMGYLGDRRTEAILYEVEGGKIEYAVDTIRELEQSVYRGVRHEKDWCRIWIIDESFDNIYQMKGLLSAYFLASVRPKGDYMSRV
jgi:Rad3-related DNA helicase